MQSYILKPDEVLLYEGEVTNNGIHSVNMKLTNYALVFSWTEKSGHGRKKVIEDKIEQYPLESVKIYNNEPLIKQALDTVTIQTTYGDLVIVMDGFFKVRTFCAKLREAITGQTYSERGAKKANKAIGLVDDALGIDTIETVTGVMQQGVVGTILGGIGSKKKNKTETIAESLETVGQIISTPKVANEKSKEISYEEQINLLKSLNELKDQGIITQEEFEAKKKEILGL